MAKAGAGKARREDMQVRGIINIILGLVMIAGGLSGRLVLIGTNSGLLLAVLGLFLVGLGVFRLANRGQ